MVSLIDRVGYYCLITDKPKITCFNSFVKGEAVSHTIPEDTNETDKVYFALLKSISKNQKEDFLTAYNNFSRRRPSTENAWIHNEFLLFVLICGIEKYQADKTWINEVIQVRSASNNQQYLSMNQTFRNILTGNMNSTDNINEIVIVFQDLMNRPQLSREVLDTTYVSLSNKVGLIDTKDDFLITMSFRAFDVILLSKDTPDATEITRIKDFKKIFNRRIRLIVNIIYYGLLLLFVLISVQYIRQYADLKDYVSDLGAVFQLGGLAFLAAFRWIKKMLKLLLLFIFGYHPLFNKN